MDNGASSYRRFLQGDNSGLEEIVEMYNDSLIFFVNRYVNNVYEAEDLAADTFFELIVRKNKFKERCSFKTWLFKIARNNAIDYLRKQSKRKHQSIDDTGIELVDIENLEKTVLINEQKKQLYKAMNGINTEYKEILYLLNFEDMSYSEVGVVLQKNIKQIKNLAYRARQSLKTALEKDGFNYENL